VGGLSWQTDERKLQEAFDRFGKVVDAQFGVVRGAISGGFMLRRRVVQGGKVDLWIALVCGPTGICFAYEVCLCFLVFMLLAQIGERIINFFS